MLSALLEYLKYVVYLLPIKNIYIFTLENIYIIYLSIVFSSSKILHTSMPKSISAIIIKNRRRARTVYCNSLLFLDLFLILDHISMLSLTITNLAFHKPFVDFFSKYSTSDGKTRMSYVTWLFNLFADVLVKGKCKSE